MYIVPLEQIEYGVYEDLINNIFRGIFYLLKGDYIPMYVDPVFEASHMT